MKNGELTICQKVSSLRLLAYTLLILVTITLVGHNLFFAFADSPPSSETIVERAAQALGGLKMMQELKSISVVADGERYEPGQKFSPEEYPKYVSSYHYNLTQDIVGNKMRTEWERLAVYPYPQDLRYTVIINNDTGFTNGKDGYFSPAQAPMRSSAVSAWQKEQLLSSPLLLMRLALIHPESVTVQGDEKYNGKLYHVIQLAVKQNTEPFRIFLDDRTFLPAKVTTLEDDPIHGDTPIVVLYDDWRNVNGVFFPFSVTHLLRSEVIEEKRAHVNIGMESPSESFVIPNNITHSFDSSDYLLGWQSSQWFLRMHAFGIPHYNRHLPVNFTEISPGVYHVTGSTHNSLVIEMKNYTVVVEAPLYEERSKAVIHEINSRWPDKPIRYIVSTHAHDDHIGGIRTYAAEGATIVTSNVSKEAVQSILSAPHTIRPDELQLNKRKVDIVTVSENKTITDGNRTIEILPVKNFHSTDMLAVYLPKERILLDSDLYSPGGVPPAFKVYSKQLLDFINQSRLVVQTIAGTHGTFGPFSDLQKVVHQNQNQSEGDSGKVAWEQQHFVSR